jgi:hypothetical protein
MLQSSLPKPSFTINRSIFRTASGRDETSYYLLPCQSKILLGTRDRHGHGEEGNMAMNREQTYATTEAGFIRLWLETTGELL